MTLPLSKCYDPDDFTELAEELATVDRVSPNENDLRRFEYAMALRAQAVWMDTSGHREMGQRIVDVGGAGPFYQMLGDNVYVVDPTQNYTLAEYLATEPRLSRQVYCVSVLEHVDDLDEFLYHLSCLVAPGGLLFLTMDYQPHVGLKDERPFHWMRKRLFDRDSLESVFAAFDQRDFTFLGEMDWTWKVDYQNWGYSACSLALRKRA